MTDPNVSPPASKWFGSEHFFMWLAIVAVAVVGGWGLFEGMHANRSGKRLTQWADEKVVPWALHVQWHSHDNAARIAAIGTNAAPTAQPTGLQNDESRRDHMSPPPPPPEW